MENDKRSMTEVFPTRVREMTRADTSQWIEMRRALWPLTSSEENAREVAVILAQRDAWGFIAADERGAPIGFAEVSVRAYANGCEETPVAFLEGIWVTPALRRRGVGGRIISHIADFLLEKGFREMCSDAVIDNHESHDAHQGWGFVETERVVYFRKALG